MIVYMVVGAGSFGRGISELGATAEWARRANVQRVREGDITVRVYRGEDIEFPPNDEDEWSEVVLEQDVVQKLHVMAELLDDATGDPEYVASQLKRINI